MGLFGFTSFNSFYYIAAHDTIALNLGLVQGTMPAFIIIISRFWLKEQINLPQLFGVLITFFAVLLVVSSGDPYALLKLQLNKGDIVMIFACTLYAVYAVYAVNTVMVVKAAEGANAVYVVIVKAAVSGKAV